MSRTGQQDWLSLVQQTNDLVAQDRHGYPKVQRDLTGLLLSSQSARARTSRVRSQTEQAAATRLLAMQGFDAGRLNQDVASLELQPTLEDVFHADTTSVEEYLQQIQDMTILTAIQEAQQDTIMSFERYMSDCMTRDWATDKQGLFSSVAPYTGLGGAAAGGLSFGSVARADVAASFTGGATLGPKEQAYVAVVKQLNTAAAQKQPVDPISAFGAACEQYEDKTPDTLMSNCWKLLGDILSVTRARGIAPGQDDYVDALLQGCRKHLEAGFANHMTSVISRHRSTAQRGADPDPLRDVQAFLAVKFRDKGVLDINATGGIDTTWTQVYYSLRAGMHDVAIKAADRASDPTQSRPGGSSVIKQLLQHWLQDAVGFRKQHGARMVQECERLLQGYSQKQNQLKQDYQLLVYALLGGDSRSVDNLFKLSPGLFPTMEDYIWIKLSLVNTSSSAADVGIRANSSGAMYNLSGSFSPSSGGAGGSVYTLASLQQELNRWGPKYYSKNGKEPLLYLTVLLLSLQFKRALQFMLKEEMFKNYRLDGIHLAIALYFCQVLRYDTEDASAGSPLDVDLAAQVAAFGGRYTTTDSTTALHYYMLAAALAGGGAKEQGRLLRELLVQSKDYGTLLGGGGPMGSGGAIAQFVPEPAQRQRLFESVAYDCQINQQPSEAIEMFMAAQKPRAALKIINQQLSAAIHAQQGALTEHVAALLSRGQAAVEAIGSAAPDANSRKDADAFQQLQLIRQMVQLAGQQQWDRVLQDATKLTFLPTERARIDVCKLEVKQLDDSVRERMSDVLEIVAEGIMQLRNSADNTMLSLLRERVACLKVFVLDLDPSITPSVYERINACVREFA